MGRFPPDFQAIVAQEHSKTAGYVWAAQEPGLAACRFEAHSVKGRRFIDISSGSLQGYPAHNRWIVGFFIIELRDLSKPLAWAGGIEPYDRRRIVFLLAPDVDEQEAIDAIAEHAPGCVIDVAQGLRSAATASAVHGKFGEYHARQAYDDQGMPV